MIPREILKKIRQIELHTNRLVNGSTQRVDLRIPTDNYGGFATIRSRASARMNSGSNPVEFDGIKHFSEHRFTRLTA